MQKSLIMFLVLIFTSLYGQTYQVVQPTKMALIPTGTFAMGGKGSLDCGPIHEVIVDSFYIDIHEVTNAQYYAFCQSTGRKLPEFWGMDVYRSGIKYPKHPVASSRDEIAS